MKSFLIASLALLSTSTLAAASPLGTSSQLSAQERTALSTTSDDSLLNLRAGAARDTARFSGDELEILARAQQNSPELADMRGGAVAVTDHDLIIIGVVLLAVILIVAL